MGGGRITRFRYQKWPCTPLRGPRARKLHLGRDCVHRPDTLMQTAKSQIAETACRRGGPYVFGRDSHRNVPETFLRIGFSGYAGGSWWGTQGANMPADAAAASSPSVSDLQRQIDELAAELRARTADYEQALRREAAVAEILQVVNASTGDLVQVFDSMLEKATRLCEADAGALATY